MTSTRSPGVTSSTSLVVGRSCSPPSVPITVNFCPCRSSRKNRLRAVLTMRQRCGAPERTRSTGALRPFTSTCSPSRPNTSPAAPPLSAASSAPFRSKPMSLSTIVN